MTTLRTLPVLDTPLAPRRRLPRRTLILGAFGLVLVIALGVWLVAFSSVFGVGKVVVKGTHVLRPATVERAARITADTPLIRLDTGAVARRVEALPEVASATVVVDYPSTVVITVRERVAVGYLVTPSGYQLVDRTGLAYRTLLHEPSNLPKFVLSADAAGRSTRAATATVAGDLSKALLRHVVSIQALDPTSISLLLTDGRIVQWGSVARSADKARLLPTLLGQRASIYDVTDPDQPFLRK